MMINVDRYIC